MSNAFKAMPNIVHLATLLSCLALIVANCLPTISSQSLTSSNSTLNKNTDAPKFYHLNELLYKSTSGAASPQAVALPAGSLRPRPVGEARPSISRGASGSADDGDTDDSFEGLVRRMRGRRPDTTTATAKGADGDAELDTQVGGAKRAPTNGGPKTTPPSPGTSIRDEDADEPTIQRKQTTSNFNDHDDGLPETAGPAKSPSSRVRARGE